MNLSKIIYNWCFCIQKIGLLVKKISESHEICVIPKKHPPTQSVRFTTHKEISEIREICVSPKKHKTPHNP